MVNNIGISQKLDIPRIKKLLSIGLFGMVLEGLSFFAVYQMMAPYSPKHAHSLRAGIFGYLMFGACGYHVPTCALVFLTKHGLAEELTLRYAAYFILPAIVLFWIFFVVLEIAHIKAFISGQTPLPKWSFLFSLPVGMVIAMVPSMFANLPLFNALACAWIAFGNLWMFCGLLVLVCRIKRD